MTERLSDLSLKGKLEAIIYAAEEPVTVDQLTLLLKESVINDDSLSVPRTRGGAGGSRRAAFVRRSKNSSPNTPTTIAASRSARLPADTACPPSPSITTWFADSPRA